jgi:hypothetical protein
MLVLHNSIQLLNIRRSGLKDKPPEAPRRNAIRRKILEEKEQEAPASWPEDRLKESNRKSTQR